MKKKLFGLALCGCLALGLFAAATVVSNGQTNPTPQLLASCQDSPTWQGVIAPPMPGPGTPPVQW